MMVAQSALAQTANGASQKSPALNRKAAQAALHAGYQSLTAKKTKQAITALSQAIKSGKLRSSEMAKALYYRGQAYRAAKRPADAIADLTSALWMKGALSERERKAALALRQQTYQQLGVAGPALSFGSTTTTQTTTTGTQSPKSPAPKRPPAARTASTQKKSNSSAWTAQTSPAKPATNSNPLASASNGVTNFFNSLFGGGSNTTPTTGSVTPPSKTARAATANQRPSSSASRTTVARTSTRTPSTRQPTGRYFIQVASVRDPGQAKTLANSVTQRHQALLKGRKPTIETGVLGNMGTFYLVRIRAFRSQTEAAKLCRQLLASGLDCLVNKS